MAEFVFIIRALVLHVRRSQRQRTTEAFEAREEGPPLGAIVQGAQNWDGLTEDASSRTFDLEEIGTEEALKPVPPAYGMYRGSIRIADSDIRCVNISVDRLTIRWVPLRGEGEPTIEENMEESQLDGSRRPPSYGTENGRT